MAFYLFSQAVQKCWATFAFRRFLADGPHQTLFLQDGQVMPSIRRGHFQGTAKLIYFNDPARAYIFQQALARSCHQPGYPGLIILDFLFMQIYINFNER